MTPIKFHNALRRGSLLIITLWIITILGIFAVAIGRYLSREIRLSKYYRARVEAENLARSGALMVAAALQLDSNDYDWPGEDWGSSWELPLEQPGQRLTIVKVEDEERLLNLNAATSGQITQLLSNFQITQPQVIANGIINHINGTALPEPPYYPKGSALISHQELWALPVIQAQPEAYPVLKRHTSVALAADKDTVNINTAEYEVLRAIAGPTLGDGVPSESVLQPLIAVRPGADGVFSFDPDDDCYVTKQELDAGGAATKLGESIRCLNSGAEPFVTLLSKSDVTFTVNSTLFRVEILAELENPPVTQRYEALIYRPLDSAGGDPAILSWKEL